MALCDGAHRMLDGIANGEVQVGPLPPWTRVQGKVAWWVAQGPLENLGAAWGTFHGKVGALRPGVPDGPPGDVYACRPEDHVDDQQRRLLTLLYLPIR